MEKRQRSMIPADARQTLLDLIDELKYILDDLQDREYKGRLDMYGEGLKAAYVQMLEFIQQRWEEADSVGLDFDIEDEYPV